MVARSVLGALAPLGLAATLLWPVTVFAQQRSDLSRATCADLASVPDNDRPQLLLWLHGYFSGAAQVPVIDSATYQKAVAALAPLCAQQPTIRLLGAEVRQLFLTGASAAPAAPAAGVPTVTPGVPPTNPPPPAAPR